MSIEWPRVIAHADMDAFYAAIEQLDDPTLRGKPVLVGPPSSRGVVLTASYEARPYKVGSAMPMARARQLCPDAIVVPPRFERYQEISKAIMALFADFSPVVEPLSLDEAFLDMTGSDKIFGAPQSIGQRLKSAIRAVTGGLTVSIGLSGTKYVAKVASGFRKPDGLTVVPPAEARSWLAPLPVAHLWGAGPKTQLRLQELGLETIGDVAARTPEYLASVLGSIGRHFHSLALGEDPRRVSGDRSAKSLGSERTLNVDVSTRVEIEHHLRKAAETVASRLRRRGARAHGVRVKLKRTDFKILTRQCSLTSPSDSAAQLFAAAAGLLGAFGDPGPFRLVGLAAYGIAEAEESAQLDLPMLGASRNRNLEATLDRLSDRFGEGIVQRAAELVRDRGVGVGANLDFLAEPDHEEE
jgi:DNA polymerase IV